MRLANPFTRENRLAMKFLFDNTRFVPTALLGELVEIHDEDLKDRTEMELFELFPANTIGFTSTMDERAVLVVHYHYEGIRELYYGGYTVDGTPYLEADQNLTYDFGNTKYRLMADLRTLMEGVEPFNDLWVRMCAYVGREMMAGGYSGWTLPCGPVVQ